MEVDYLSTHFCIAAIDIYAGGNSGEAEGWLGAEGVAGCCWRRAGGGGDCLNDINGGKGFDIEGYDGSICDRYGGSGEREGCDYIIGGNRFDIQSDYLDRGHCGGSGREGDRN